MALRHWLWWNTSKGHTHKWRHHDYCIVVLRWLPSRPVARFQYLVGHNTFLGGKIFAFAICLKQIFWEQQNLGGTKEIWGSTAPEYPPYGPTSFQVDRFIKCMRVGGLQRTMVHLCCKPPSLKGTVYSRKSFALGIKFNMPNAVIWFIEAKCIVGKVKPP